MFANIWKPWCAKHKHLQHLPCNTRFYADNEWYWIKSNLTVPLNACDLCVLCLSIFSRSNSSNSRLQTSPFTFYIIKSFASLSVHSTEPCILSLPNICRTAWQYPSYNMLQNLQIFAVSWRDVNCCSLHWCHITTVQFCHLREGWHHLSCKKMYIGNMPCQNWVNHGGPLSVVKAFNFLRWSLKGVLVLGGPL